jgi:phosphoglycerate dehydrogenase-like enzyme
VKALFLGNVAADTAEGIRSELPPELKLEIIANPKDLPQSPEAAAEADILVTNIWRADYPPAPQVRLVQSVATGIEWIEQAALPRGVAVCNAYGHETAIAEYVLMTMLVWSHRFREIEGDFRLRSSWAPSWVHSGAPHGEIRGSTLGIVGLGRVGHEVARRAAVFGCHVLAANRSPREPGDGVERVYPLSELDQMLPLCDTVAICSALGAIVDEDALFAALCAGTIGGAAIDVWWQYPTAAEPERRPSRHPFHELPNVIMTPHCSGWTAGMVRRRWD